MGSGAEAVHETVDYLTSQGEKVGVVKVRLYRPFDMQRFMEALPGHDASDRCLRPHQRTRQCGRTTLSGHVLSSLYEGLGAGWGDLRDMPIGGRWPLRLILQGIHARHD